MSTNYVIEGLQRLATEHEHGADNLKNYAEQTTQNYRGTRLKLEGAGNPIELHFMKMYFKKNGDPAVELHEDPQVPYASSVRIEGDAFQKQRMAPGSLKTYLENEEYDFVPEHKQLLKNLLFGYRQ